MQTSGDATLLLVVTSEGGFIAPSAHLGDLPTVVVDTAGDIYEAGPVPTCPSGITYGLLIPHVGVRDVGANGAAQILAAMREAGLDAAGPSGVTGDAGVTVFTAEIDGQEVVNRVAAGGPGPGHPGSSPAPAFDLLNRLLDAGETWGTADVVSATFVPTAYKIYAARVADGGSSTAEWPLASLAEFGSPATPDFGVSGLRTGVVFGDDAPRLAMELGNQTSDTLVTSDGASYQIWIRPLLPPELTQ